MGKFITTVLKILFVVGVGGVIVVGVAGAGGFVWYRGLPKVEVTNQCGNAIVIPEQFQSIPAVPSEIPVGGSITVPVISGSGEYSLYEADGEMRIGLPHSLPMLGDTIRVGSAGSEPNATFEGQPVTVPMQRQFDSQTYSVVLCAQ